MKRLILTLGVLLCLQPASPSAAATAALPVSTVSGIRYLDVERYCLDRGLAYAWDPVAKTASVSAASGVLRFGIDGEYALKDDRLLPLDAKTLWLKGAVMVPASAQAYLESLLPGAPPPATVSRIAAPPKASLSAPAARIRKVVIDAGHGGEDTGAISPLGTREKGIALDVARRVRDRLRAQGLEVIMTRDRDVFLPLAMRASIANKSGADLFVSIHANASTSHALRGFEIYYLSEATDDAALAVERAENSSLRFETASTAAPTKDRRAIFWDLKETQNRKESLKIAQGISQAMDRSVPIAANRIRTANFYVLKWTECPAVLVETGYVSNRLDEHRLKRPAYRQSLADAVVEGLLAYKREFERTDGFTR